MVGRCNSNFVQAVGRPCNGGQANPVGGVLMFLVVERGNTARNSH